MFSASGKAMIRIVAKTDSQRHGLTEFTISVEKKQLVHWHVVNCSVINGSSQSRRKMVNVVGTDNSVCKDRVK